MTPKYSTRKCAILGKLVLLCMCASVQSHILIYRHITNQIIEEYDDLPAQFGSSLPPLGLKVYAVPLKDIKADDYGCDKIPPPQRSDYPSNAKFVVIIQRGGENCTFEKKVRNAQAAGYAAAIVYNSEGDDLEVMSAKNSSGIHIPSVFVGNTAGVSLQSYYSEEVVLVINDELPFNINTQLILPFSILIGLCFLIMVFYMVYKCIREERRLRRHRLPKSMLKKLAIIKYDKNSELAYETCVICLDEFVEGDKLRVLPCKHPYHTHCIDPWLTENRRFCPICKRKVFTKGEARSYRNRQYSLDSVTDTDDDTTPLLQQNSSDARNSRTAAGAAGNTSSSTRHGTFRSGRSQTSRAEPVSTDDEAALQSPRRRINPFDRNTESSEAAITTPAPRRWWQLFSWPSSNSASLSVAAPPFLEVEVVNDSMVRSQPAASSTLLTTAAVSATSSSASNNILNPNLSGSFKASDEQEARAQGNSSEDDNQSLASQTIYEAPNEVISSTVNPDSVFIQTPTRGGIGVVALPNTNNEIPRQFYG